MCTIVSNFYSMSEEEEDADDTADSLDIKPPQASVIHHHKPSSSRSSSSKRDKHSERDSGRREHVSSFISNATIAVEEKVFLICGISSPALSHFLCSAPPTA